MGRKEDNIKRAETLLHKKEFIRNIGTAAHIDHGKWVQEATRVLFGREWMAAKDLFQRFVDRPTVKETRDETVKDLRHLNLRILAFEGDSKRLVQRSLIYACKVRFSRAPVREA